MFGPPAFTVATGFTVMTTVDVAALHGPAPSGSFVVNVSVTVPDVIDGVYVEVSVEASENVPLGAVQVELVELPPILPASVTELPAQTVWAVPAFAVAACVTVMVLVALTAGHGPVGSFVVSVKITVPLKLAVGV